ncbi:MAG: DUF4199 domain-containing protein [Bacteroidota bacterium]
MGKNKNLITTSVLFGLMMAGVFILYDMLNYTFDFAKMGMLMGIVSFLIWLAIYIVFYIYGGRSYRNKYSEGYLNFAKAFLICAIMAVVSSLVLVLYNYLFYYFFDPQRAVNTAQQIAEQIQNNSNIPDEKKEEIIKSIYEGSTPYKIVIKSLISTPIIALVIGTISALFIRKKEKISEVF